MDYSALIEDLKRKREAISDVLGALEKLDSLNVLIPTQKIIQRPDVGASRRARQKQKLVLRRRTKLKLGQNIKACSKCGKIKNLDEFVKSKLCRDGHENTCLECRRSQIRNWQKKRRLDEMSSRPNSESLRSDSKLVCKLCNAPASSEERLHSHMRTVHLIDH